MSHISKFKTTYIFSSLLGSLVIIFVLVSCSQSFLSLVYAQSEGTNDLRPITTKVIPSNLTATTSTVPSYNIDPITTKVIPSNLTATTSTAPSYNIDPITTKSLISNLTANPSSFSPSYSVTNASITFNSESIPGDLTTNRETSIVTNSSFTSITGNIAEAFDTKVLEPPVERIVSGRIL
jgi:hypothetical protein